MKKHQSHSPRRFPKIFANMPPSQRLLLALVIIMGAALVAGFTIVLATIITRALLLLT